eukprot:117317-Alexandrium_andersonii.AAC.1
MANEGSAEQVLAVGSLLVFPLPPTGASVIMWLPAAPRCLSGGWGCYRPSGPPPTGATGASGTQAAQPSRKGYQ